MKIDDLKVGDLIPIHTYLVNVHSEGLEATVINRDENLVLCKLKYKGVIVGTMVASKLNKKWSWVCTA